jgi:hypothetical protein
MHAYSGRDYLIDMQCAACRWFGDVEGEKSISERGVLYARD